VKSRKVLACIGALAARHLYYEPKRKEGSSNMRIHKRRNLIVGGGLACGLVLSSAAALAQTDTLYVTNGDGARLAIVQGGTLQSVMTTYVRAYPIAVRDTIWIGDYNGNSPNSAEYDLAGNPTGNTAPYNPVLAVDGAVNGSTNYELGNAFGTTGTVYSADADWQNETAMFNAPGNDVVGITFDSVAGTIWVSDQNNLYEYDTVGNLVSKFAHSSGRGCIAYEPSTDTIWYVTNGTDTITQYAKTGAKLQTLNVTGLASNNWGAEFAVSGDCLDMTVSTLAGGQNATWDVDGATPGARVAVVYGTKAGTTVVNGQFGYCATFGIKGVNSNKLVGSKIADGNGHVTVLKRIPGSASGLTILTQAAEQGTCPKECLSGVDTQVVQ